MESERRFPPPEAVLVTTNSTGPIKPTNPTLPSDPSNRANTMKSMQCQHTHVPMHSNAHSRTHIHRQVLSCLHRPVAASLTTLTNAHSYTHAHMLTHRCYCAYIDPLLALTHTHILAHRCYRAYIGPLLRLSPRLRMHIHTHTFTQVLPRLHRAFAASLTSLGGVQRSDGDKLTHPA
jgi:hypothetical protein